MNTTKITRTIHQRNPVVGIAAAVTALAMMGMLTACGGGNSSGSNPITPAAKTAVQVNLGDAPADWMLAFSMNISSMSLTGSNGNVSVVTSTTPMEMIHLMGTMQPLAMVSAPQGSYTGASIAIGSVTVMYMDPTTKALVQKSIPGPISGTVTFSSPITVGSTPMAIGFDLDLASSVTADASGNLTMNPVFHVSSGMQGSGSPLDPANGGIQQMMGTVAGISGSSFSMNSTQAAQAFTFATNSSTTFSNMTGMSMMANGMVMLVDASLQPDGSLMATHVQSMMSSGGGMGGGTITAVSGQPATQLTMVMQNGVGTGIMSSVFAAGATVSMNASTTYEIGQHSLDMSGLPFTPTFDANHIYTGQNVMPVSSAGMVGGGMGSGMMGGSPLAGTMAASGVVLQPQGLKGTLSATITSGVRGNFTLTLPAQSAFTSMTGATTVTVFQQTGTTIVGASSLTSGATVHVSGILFFDAGQWKMVAARIGS